MRNFSSPSLNVTLRKIARIVALELALGLKNLLQRTSLSVRELLTRGGSTGIYSCLPPLLQKPLKLEQHHDLSLLVNQLV